MKKKKKGRTLIGGGGGGGREEAVELAVEPRHQPVRHGRILAEELGRRVAEAAGDVGQRRHPAARLVDAAPELGRRDARPVARPRADGQLVADALVAPRQRPRLQVLARHRRGVAEAVVDAVGRRRPRLGPGQLQPRRAGLRGRGDGVRPRAGRSRPGPDSPRGRGRWR